MTSASGLTLKELKAPLKTEKTLLEDAKHAILEQLKIIKVGITQLRACTLNQLAFLRPRR